MVTRMEGVLVPSFYARAVQEKEYTRAVSAAVTATVLVTAMTEIKVENDPVIKLPGS
jgi:hypothetical protein